MRCDYDGNKLTSSFSIVEQTRHGSGLMEKLERLKRVTEELFYASQEHSHKTRNDCGDG